MDYVTADWSAAPLSRIALGCEILGGSDWGEVDVGAAIAAVRSAVELGVTVFDTADVYGLGRSEEVLAQSLGRSLSEMLVVTKGGVAWRAGESGARAATFKTLRPEHLRRAVHGSLRRLRLETIPLYLAHWPDDVTAVDDVIDTLSRLRDDGLVGAFGLSNFSASDLADSRALAHINALEASHSLASSGAPVLRMAGKAGVLRLTYGALAQGLLSGKYPPAHTFDTGDRRHRLTQFGARRTSYEPLLSTLRDVAREVDSTPAQVAIRWVLDSGCSESVVVGARNPQQLQLNIAASELSLSAAQLARLERVANDSPG